MKTQVRVLFVFAAVALVAGWMGLRHGNAALEVRLAGDRPAASAAGTP
jgi:ABC-type uncharacterized transport system permease subunit